MNRLIFALMCIYAMYTPIAMAHNHEINFPPPMQQQPSPSVIQQQNMFTPQQPEPSFFQPQPLNPQMFPQQNSFQARPPPMQPMQPMQPLNTQNAFSHRSEPMSIFTQIQSQIFNKPTQPNLMDSFGKFTPNSILINNYAQTGINVARQIASQENLQSDPNGSQKLGSLKAPPKYCPFKGIIKCDPKFPYRSLDGTCNNLKNLWWGQSETPYKRILEPAYADYFNEPRVSVDGSELPNPREIACALHSESHEIEPFINHIFMQWGQFINHDITSLSVTRDEERNISICNSCTRTEKCLPIMIRSNKTCNCISQMTHPCIEFTRASASFSDIECSLGKREQLNLQTSFIDGSLVYGVKKEDLDNLRDKVIGRGRMLVQAKTNLLPKDMTKEPSDCLDFTEEKRCFRAGDDRVNQNAGLMTFQTIFVREHNRIADMLSLINPSWEDETVFQEARRVVIAMIQHITYNEYLPVLLGTKISEQLGLLPGKGQEQNFKHNSDIDPRIANEYASAAGRFGHSMIRSSYSRLNNKYEAAGATPFMLRHAYFRANMIYDKCQGGLESIVRGFLKDPVMKVDRWFSDEITKHLFETTDDFGRPFHFDLVSINIQRGRDHGVPGYVKFRDYCKLAPVRTWTEMKQFVSADSVEIFKTLYKYVDDVDLFSAMVAEFKQDGALVGPTLTCLLGLQYRDLKFGDRFWYESTEFPVGFTAPQLAEIRKMSLAKLLCRNMEDTPEIQPRAMLSVKVKENALQNCANLTDINWNLWMV